MNKILELRKEFNFSKSQSRPGPLTLSKNKKIFSTHLKNIRDQLVKVKKYWKNEKLNLVPLVNVEYCEIVAKSNRISAIFDINSTNSEIEIVGAKFSEGNINKRHIITYLISFDHIKRAIDDLNIVIDFVDNKIGEEVIDSSFFDRVNKGDLKHFFEKDSQIKRSKFLQILKDCVYVWNITIPTSNLDSKDARIVSIYKNKVNSSTILDQIGIKVNFNNTLDDNTFLLSPEEIDLLNKNAPYLISMSVTDLNNMEEIRMVDHEANYNLSIPSPTNEPVIGVIDTLFSENVYFNEWVEYHDMVDQNIPRTIDDTLHGTFVTSIIVDGPNLNKDLDDGCGRFKVKHFGVAKAESFSSFSIMKNIEKIVSENKDIKVWNLSLGSPFEISKNSISPEASILDRIQKENDVIFVISGTNKKKGVNKEMKIGSPADSINSIIVNSVDRNNKIASYSRFGEVLSFYRKPDICYYGGANGDFIAAHSGYEVCKVYGTSFAAPWITRKVAYLIYILGFSKEVAKALIIDSSTGWEKFDNEGNKYGYGVVPVKITDIVSSKNDEIKFVISGISSKYETYTYDIPVPISNDKHPYVAKATLVYFPSCSRNMGVDYTNSELDIYFGRVKKNSNGSVTINSINENHQSQEYDVGEKINDHSEANVRREFRKWDNVKHIQENLHTKNNRIKKPKTKLTSGMYGISIKKKNRNGDFDANIKYGLVITLKDLEGKNRIDSFIQNCQLNGWLVNRIDIENKLELYNLMDQEIELK